MKMREAAAINKDIEACEQEYKIGSYESCANNLNQILKHLPLIPDHEESINKEKEILSLLITCYIALYGYGSSQVAEAISRATALGEELQDTSFIFSILWTNWSNVIVNGNIIQAQRFATEIMDLAEKNPSDKVIFVEAFHCLGVTEFNAGQFQESAKFLSTGLKKFDAKNRKLHIYNYGNDAEILLLSWLSWAKLLCGDQQSYLNYQNKLLTAMRKSEHNSSYAFGYVFNAMGYVFQDNAKACIHALRSLDRTKADALPFWNSWANIVRKWAEYRETGVFQSIEEDIQHFIQLQGGIWEPFFKVLMADMNTRQNPALAAEIFATLVRNIKLGKSSFHSLPILYFSSKYYRKLNPDKYEEIRALAKHIRVKQGARYWEWRI